MGSHDAEAEELRIEGACIVFTRTCRSVMQENETWYIHDTSENRKLPT